MITDAFYSIEDYQKSLLADFTENDIATIPADCAVKSREHQYACPWCGVPLIIKTSPKGTAFYCCLPNQPHKAEICIRRETERVTHSFDGKGFSVEHFFSGLFNEPEPRDKSSSSDPFTYYEEPSESNPSSVQEDKEKIAAYTSIKQIVEDDVIVKGPNYPIGGGHSLKDMFMPGKWIPRFLPRFTGGQLILECIPSRIDYKRNRIDFFCFINKTDKSDKPDYYNFSLYFGKKKKPFETYCRKLFHKEKNADGTQRDVRSFSTVFIAGKWEREENNSSSRSNKPNTFRSVFYTPKQIYLPHQKIDK